MFFSIILVQINIYQKPLNKILYWQLATAETASCDHGGYTYIYPMKILSELINLKLNYKLPIGNNSIKTGARLLIY